MYSFVNRLINRFAYRYGKWEIDRHPVISFDIFNTLLSRLCEKPECVFELVESTSSDIISHDGMSFKALRIGAANSCSKSIFAPTLDQIYSYLPISQFARSSLKNIEIETERVVSWRKELGYDLYQYAKRQGKKIIAISDMYLDSRTIKDLLTASGYNINHIVVSCEYHAEKYDGKLFHAALNEFEIDKKEIVHFGDHIVSDLIGARRAGIDVSWVPNTTNLKYVKKSNNHFSDNYLLPFINQHLAQIPDTAEAIGYEVFGPLIVGFCQWLHQRLHDGNYNRALFCARDMRQTIDIYIKLYPEDNELVRYFYVSVKSLSVAYRAKLDSECSEEAMRQLAYLREYLSQLGCSGKVAIVDSGINGRSQKMLSAIMGDTLEIHGFYMRISNNFMQNVKDVESKAYLNDGKPDTKLFIGALFYEALISASHGRTLLYKKQDGLITPIFGSSNTNTISYKRLQDGITRFASDFLNSPYKDRVIDPGPFQKALISLTFFPKREDVHSLKDIRGGNESFQPIVLETGFLYFLFLPQVFIKNLKDTYWKGGYMSRSFLVLSRPLTALYILIDSLKINLFGSWSDSLDPQ